MATTYLKDYQPHPFSISHVDLTVDLQDSATLVTSVLTVKKESHSGELYLHGENLVLKSVAINGEPYKDFQKDDHGLTLVVPHETCTITIQNEIEPQNNFSGVGLYQSGTIFCTQCEAQGFRRITYFIDRPDNMATFTTKLIADKKFPVLLSNGNLIEKGDMEDGRHFAVWKDPFKKPSYLFAMVFGDLGKIEDQFTTRSNKKVQLEIYVDHGNESKAQYAMESLQRAMKWDEDRFDLEYDLDRYMIVAVDSFNMGAMENKGLNIFNSAYTLADVETAEDQDFQNIERIIGHEYFHNWTGNRVTCRDWFQLTLKEGLTVFRDQEFTSDLHSRNVKRIEDAQFMRAHQFPEDGSAMSHPIRPLSYEEINNFYTTTVYQKGAEVIRMIHTIIGEDNFQKGMKRYFEKHDGQAVTTDDFVHCMQEASKIDLSQFKHWYGQSGTPQVDVQTHYQGGTFTLTLSQNLPKAASTAINDVVLDVPIKLALFSKDGKALLPETLIRLNQKQQSFSFDQIVSQPVLSINRGFTAPVQLKVEQSTEDLLALLKYDDDGFVQYDAAFALHRQTIFSFLKGNVQDPSVLEAFGSVIENQTMDPALKAMLLTLPSEKELNESLSEYDVEGISKARKQWKRILGETFFDAWMQMYHKNSHPTFELDGKSQSARSLKNLCLSFLVASQSQKGIDLAYEQFQKSKNFTDLKSAYAVLFLENTIYAEVVNQKMFEKFQGNALVMNKWVAFQTQSERVDLLTYLEGIKKLSVFDAKNPNKLRSLYGGFAANLSAFHKSDGSGYKFITDAIVTIDQFNPQVASRLAKSFGVLGKLDAQRKELVKANLNRVLAHNPSADVLEVVKSYLSSL